jgi:hypothetical protein
MVDGGIPFHMLSDQAGNIGRAYGVWDESQGIELRGRFIIDPDGVIQAMEVLTPPVGRRIAETIRQLQAFQVVRDSKGAEATPAGWMPGWCSGPAPTSSVTSGRSGSRSSVSPQPHHGRTATPVRRGAGPLIPHSRSRSQISPPSARPRWKRAWGYRRIGVSSSHRE